MRRVRKMKNKFKSFLILLFFLVSVFAQGTQRVEFTINKVTVISESGESFSIDYIKNLMSLRKGEVFSFRKRQEDFHRLYETGILIRLKLR